MIDQTTPYLGLPLPHHDNTLVEDVPRLRATLQQIDAKFQQLDTLLDSDDVTLDQLQELVTAIKENRTDVLDLLVTKADQSSVDALAAVKADQASLNALKVEHEETQTLADGQTVVDLLVLTSTAGATVYIEGLRLPASKWTPDGTIPTRLTLGRAYPAGSEVTIVRRQGGV